MDEINTVKPQIKLTIRSRSKTYFDGFVSHLTSKNDTGIFDILPYHANFITIVKEYLDVKDMEGKIQRFEIKGGVLRVSEDKINVYLTV